MDFFYLPERQKVLPYTNFYFALFSMGLYDILYR